VLSVICEYGVRKRLAKTNPARGIRRDAAKRTEDPWTYAILEEQARLIEEAAKDGLDCLIEFAMGSGLREGEQCMLHLCDVHLDDPDPHLWVRYGGLPTAKHPRGQPPKSGCIRRRQRRAWAPFPAKSPTPGRPPVARKTNPCGVPWRVRPPGRSVPTYSS
jgi:integrase